MKSLLLSYILEEDEQAPMWRQIVDVVLFCLFVFLLSSSLSLSLGSYYMCVVGQKKDKQSFTCRYFIIILLNIQFCFSFIFVVVFVGLIIERKSLSTD